VRWLGLGLGFLWLTNGCGTDAVGVSECRDLEQARCTAASSCGFPAVSECRRFYRDHCLHGISLETVNDIDVQACVADIERAGSCAADRGQNTIAGDCATPVATTSSRSTVCDVVLRPEIATACAFLGSTPAMPAAAPATPSSDAGGT
jgi:hypothetical protein